ncbi:phenylalanine--tRNA ligase subunit alpha [Oxyplasma meridianum]|uniref:phenylalanine--tRNA ligase n=1 Tax=Oxyplasma meridianum TaxID=3073602 RepID=A0AAX4NGQ4_9ARCH
MDLSRWENIVLKNLWILAKKGITKISETEIKEFCDLNSTEISSAVSWLDFKKLISVDKIEHKDYNLTEEGKTYLETGLPEEKLYELLKEKGKLKIRDVMEVLGPEKGKIALIQLSKFNIKPSGGEISFQISGELESTMINRKKILSKIQVSKKLDPGEMKELIELQKRGLIEERKKTVRIVSINELGINYAMNSGNAEKLEQLTPEIIAEGSWRGREFRSYDLNVPVERIIGGSLHPLTYLIREIREIFLEMGFTEMHGDYVQYAAWNMDALFIPQDHPARDLQDTFFLQSQNRINFQHPEILPKLKKVHENGISGYSGWRYSWKEEKAKELLLRTHTTVNTIKYLYEHPEPPSAIFSIEKVFRHESVDWKHLAELHQIEGAVHSKDSSLSSLKWLIRTFYRKLGFEKLSFIPAYYPYTEPSMDVVVEINGKEVELGGSGLFRPEVLRPFRIRNNVIAWGLGLERLAMLYYDLKDIREIYESDIEWLKNYRIRIT